MISFQNINFMKKENHLRINLYKMYYFEVDNEEIGDYNLINYNTIDFGLNENREYNKIMFLIEKHSNDIKNILLDKPTTIIFAQSEIPLLGHLSFGFVDRGSNLIEIKPSTGCNLKCIYCSISEGDNSRPRDFYVDADYLIESFNILAAIKENDVEAYIESHGEPLLYPQLEYFIENIKKNKKVRNIIINTNGVLLNKKRIDSLVNAGLTRFNISFDTFDEKLAKRIYGINAKPDKIVELIKYAKTKCDVLIAPVWMQGINDEDIPKIIDLGKEIGAKLGIQNFLNYKFGRNPIKEIPFKVFYEKLKHLEKEKNTKLILKAKDLDIYPDNSPKKPFKKREKIKAQIIGPGRMKNEVIAKAKDRVITIPKKIELLNRKNKEINLVITRTKHNIFMASTE